MGRRVTVGRVLRPHGLKGEVVVRRYGEAEEVLARGAELICRRGDLEFTLRVSDSRPYKKNWLVTFKDTGDRNEAEAMAGAELFVDAEALPPLPEGEFYNYQLIGLTVVNARGETLGRVEDIVETGARDVIVVHGDRGEVLLPSIPEVIRRVDVEAGIIEVELLPGLLPEAEVNEET
jgi:16S rRNA processing protein RimM